MRAGRLLFVGVALALIGKVLAATPPPSGGTVSIQPRTADGDYDASLRTFADATAEALASRGFTILDDPGHAAWEVDLTLSRVEVGTGLAKVPVDRASVSPAGGITVPLSTGQSKLVPLVRTRLELRVHRRGEAGTVWDGAAVTVREAGSRKGDDHAVATDLSRALLRSYPAEPEAVVGVP